MSITLPDNPSTSSAEVGKSFMLSVNTGTVEVPKWTLVGGQRNSGMTRQADSIDVSHKTSGGWSSTKAGLRSWSISLDALFIMGDEGIQALDEAFTAGKDVNIKLEYPDKSYQTGWASITEFSLDVPHDGAASISGTLSGNGPLTEKTTD